MLSAFSYGLDKVGNRLQVTSSRGDVTRYGYDGLYRLTSWITPAGQITQYLYDAVGNRTSMVSPAGTTNHSYDAADQLLTAGSMTFTYDGTGRALVFSAETAGGRPMIWVRSMEQVAARELAGTEDAQDPFWSPDGSWIGFFAAGKLKKIPAAGGPAQVITETATDFRGGTWGIASTILFGSGTGSILRVNSTGGKTTPATLMDASRTDSDRNPYFLPNGNHFLYTIAAGMTDQTGVYVGSLDGKRPTSF